MAFNKVNTFSCTEMGRRFPSTTSPGCFLMVAWLQDGSRRRLNNSPADRESTANKTRDHPVLSFAPRSRPKSGGWPTSPAFITDLREPNHTPRVPHFSRCLRKVRAAYPWREVGTVGVYPSGARQSSLF